MFDVVLVGADDSPTARRAVEAAVEIAETYSSALHIVSAFGAKHIAESASPAEFRFLNTEGEVDALLQTLSFIATKKGITPVLHAGKGDPTEVVIRVAEEVHADLVVVGNRGMKGVRRVLGSVPNSIAHGAPCSVMIVDTTE